MTNFQAPTEERTPTAASRRQLLLMLLGLLLLCVAVYSPVHQFGFLNYDDQTYVWQNQHVLSGFTADSLHYALTATFGGWSPLVWISYLLDRQFFGATPGLIHTENVAWHALGGLVLWMLLTQATGTLFRSWIVAAIFLCHPMHVESVAWIAERKDVLSTPLLLGAMLAYCGYCKHPPGARRWILYTLMLLLFVLSLMTKVMGVTLPLLLLLLDDWPLRRIPRLKMSAATAWWLVEKIPVFAVTFVFAIVSLNTQQASRATAAGAALPLLDRIDNAIVCYLIYAMKLLAPTSFAAFYPHPGSRPLVQVIAAGGVLTLLTWLAICNRRKAPYLIAGWLWFLIALLPVIGLVQVGGQAMADRYSYLPSIGLFIAVVWGVSDLMNRVRHGVHSQRRRWFSSAVTLAVLTLFTTIARRQVWYWQDDQTLFAHCYQVTGPNPVACFALGAAAYSHGQLQSAVDNFTMVVEQDPGNDKALKFLGDLWLNHDVNKSIDYYSQAVTLKPDRPDYRISFAAALTTKGDPPSLQLAETQLQRALQIDPENSQARIGLADVRARIGEKMDSSSPFSGLRRALFEPDFDELPSV